MSASNAYSCQHKMIVEKHNSGFKKKLKYSRHHVMLSGTKLEQQVTNQNSDYSILFSNFQCQINFLLSQQLIFKEKMDTQVQLIPWYAKLPALGTALRFLLNPMKIEESLFPTDKFSVIFLFHKRLAIQHHVVLTVLQVCISSSKICCLTIKKLI